MTNIEKFKNYIKAKGYTNCETRDFSEDMHGVRCQIRCDFRSTPNWIRKDFTQVFHVVDNWFNVRLSAKDFTNDSITENLF